eukprot:1361210-Amorphochlora_amoeboformis.AAC.1
MEYTFDIPPVRPFASAAHRDCQQFPPVDTCLQLFLRFRSHTATSSTKIDILLGEIPLESSFGFRNGHVYPNLREPPPEVRLPAIQGVPHPCSSSPIAPFFWIPPPIKPLDLLAPSPCLYRIFFSSGGKARISLRVPLIRTHPRTPRYFDLRGSPSIPLSVGMSLQN